MYLDFHTLYQQKFNACKLALKTLLLTLFVEDTIYQGLLSIDG